MRLSILKQPCGKHILKVISCNLSADRREKTKRCELVTSGADLSNSTVFKIGCYLGRLACLQACGKEVKIKAAGGIASFDDAEKFIELGASRLGTSRIVKLAKNQTASGY
jgi:deoxyribose-phosphate aldolase